MHVWHDLFQVLHFLFAGIYNYFIMTVSTPFRLSLVNFWHCFSWTSWNHIEILFDVSLCLSAPSSISFALFVALSAFDKTFLNWVHEHEQLLIFNSIGRLTIIFVLWTFSPLVFDFNTCLIWSLSFPLKKGINRALTRCNQTGRRKHIFRTSSSSFFPLPFYFFYTTDIWNLFQLFFLRIIFVSFCIQRFIILLCTALEIFFLLFCNQITHEETWHKMKKKTSHPHNNSANILYSRVSKLVTFMIFLKEPDHPGKATWSSVITKPAQLSHQRQASNAADHTLKHTDPSSFLFLFWCFLFSWKTSDFRQGCCIIIVSHHHPPFLMSLFLCASFCIHFDVDQLESTRRRSPFLSVFFLFFNFFTVHSNFGWNISFIYFLTFLSISKKVIVKK